MLNGYCRTLLLSVIVVLVQAAFPLPDSSVLAASTFKMGVVDPQAVLERSRAGKRALNDLKKYRDARRKILSGDEEELRRLEEELKDGTTLSEAEQRRKQERFRQKLQALQGRAQEFNAELSQKQKELFDEYMKKISVATKIVAEKRGLALVVDKGSENSLKIVIYNKKSLDITDQVVREFDRRFK